MTVLVLSDIHANLEALTAVLNDAGPCDGVICLGDIVGYGASPAEVVDLIIELAPRWLLRGNHDRVCAGLTDALLFSPVARKAVEWTRTQLSSEQTAWLASLPAGPLSLGDSTTLCHGAPHDEDFYVLGPDDAWIALEGLRGPLCLHGHTHSQTVFRRQRDMVFDETPAHRARWAVPLTSDSQWLVNAGSVGQPRDGDPRAAYAVFDPEAETLELRRVQYDVVRAQRRIRAAGLPDVLAARLGAGN